MSDFKWNPSTDGVASKDKTSQLSDDCSIVMHAFCVFIDFQTPLDPRLVVYKKLHISFML